MNDLNYLQALVLGLVQGFTEFLPISSSGHLAVLQQLMELDAGSQAMLAFDVAAHVGTLAAVAWVFVKPFRRYLRRLLAESRASFRGRRTAWRIAGLGVAASVPTAVVGLAFRSSIEAAFGKPTWIGVALLVTGALLYVTGRIPRPRRGWRGFGVGRALLVGLSQGTALLPGISRSGATICLAMILGLRRRWAGEFSFFIAAPTICGAAVIKGAEVLRLANDEPSFLPTGPIVLGAVAALLSGYVALRVLLVALHRAKLQHFCYYCWLAGLVVIFLLNRS